MIRIGREIRCLPYAGFLYFQNKQAMHETTPGGLIVGSVYSLIQIYQPNEDMMVEAWEGKQ